MDEASKARVDLIREAFHYQSRFDGSTMVFKIDFPVTEDPLFPYLMKDLALLVQTGIRAVIVPGAKEWIDAVLAEYGVSCGYARGVRITTAEAMPFAKMAAFDTAARFMTELSASRVDAAVGNFVRARGLGVVDGVDYRHSGCVDRILVEPIRRMLDLGMVPILPCIGWSPAGKPYNLPSDEVALAACSALGAVKLFIVSAGEGLRSNRHALPDSVPRCEDGRVARLSPAEAEATLALNRPASAPDREPPADRALEELDLALRASRAGVERVHLVDGRAEGALLRELFSNLGVGTMVYADEYESIRPLAPEDVGEVLRLMEPQVRKGLLVPRGAQDILDRRDDYVVMVVDGSVHACGALRDWGEGQAEIAAIATDPDYADLGLGRRVVRYLAERAAKLGLRRAFVMTTRTHDWFELLGFRETGIDTLPAAKRAAYDAKRGSKAYAVDL